MQIMATGDLRGNIDRVRSQLRSIGYPYPLDVQGLREGIPATILPLLHYALLGYSRHVARFLSSSGYELYAKSDLRFMECLLKFLRSEFGYRCPLTLAQIFSRGFSERKLLFLHDVIQACKRKHNELSKTSRLENLMRKAKTESSMLEGCMLFKENVCRHFKQKLDFPSESIGDALPKAISACREVSAPEMDTKNKAMIQQKESGTQGGNVSNSDICKSPWSQ
ncbi:hypothetical protein O6H91_18G076600 [Diphasiastrum complanatum]|uniref:Uncharacterized protein n=1 Tax=Diphasiastrum complanatum TaxID=34168 RepID=A0ACC2B2X2_DIPCM|nr:hypothetical protein O6H91_18G076600 [Diphasiastrum complanatum]